jgi:cytochrome b pre-mRNA-processing protein 3
MFKSLFGLGRRANRDITLNIYAAIVAAARQPELYLHHHVPDTPLGRFEMLSLHMFLFLHRLRGIEGAAEDLAQEVTDRFFEDVDHSLRELGIGDLGIPKRMKKLARMFYGRTVAYGQAIDAGDVEALAAALSRNIRPEATPWPEAAALARHVLSVSGRLRAQPIDDLLQGRIEFVRQGDSRP